MTYLITYSSEDACICLAVNSSPDAKCCSILVIKIHIGACINIFLYLKTVVY